MVERNGSELTEEARTLVERLGGRWGPGGGMCRCPAHDDSDPSLSVRIGRTRLLLHCFAGCSALDILRALQSSGVMPAGAPAHWTGKDRGAAAGPFRAALRVWDAARPIAGSAAERYLAGRCVDGCSTELRYHPRTPHGPVPFTQFRPAMIAAVRDDSGIVAVHRSFLDPGAARLAVLSAPRCGLGRFGEGAVRLGGVARHIGLAEGIETALSASALFGLPCWATLGTERFARVALPATVERLSLFLDNDAGGRRAAILARAAFAHLPLDVHVPADPGSDWNDVLRARRSLTTER